MRRGRRRVALELAAGLALVYAGRQAIAYGIELAQARLLELVGVEAEDEAMPFDLNDLGELFDLADQVDPESNGRRIVINREGDAEVGRQ